MTTKRWRSIADNTWMTPEEKAVRDAIVRECLRAAKRAGAAKSPLLWLRIDEIAVSHVVVRRAEQFLALLQTDGLVEDVPALIKNAAALFDLLGKAQERLRKTMKEVEDLFKQQSAGDTPAQGLADAVKPLLERTRGVIEEAQAEAKADEKLPKPGPLAPEQTTRPTPSQANADAVPVVSAVPPVADVPVVPVVPQLESKIARDRIPWQDTLRQRYWNRPERLPPASSRTRESGREAASASRWKSAKSTESR